MRVNWFSADRSGSHDIEERNILIEVLAKFFFSNSYVIHMYAYSACMAIHPSARMYSSPKRGM